MIVTPAGEEPYTIFAQSTDARRLRARHAGRPATGLDPIAAERERHGHWTWARGTRWRPPRYCRAIPERLCRCPPLTVLPAGPTHAPAVRPRRGHARRHAEPASRSKPGVGLRDNGRRVLSLRRSRLFPIPTAASRGARSTASHRPHGRYLWSIQRRVRCGCRAAAIQTRLRLRIVLVNDGMMEHPIHLHGMWSDLEDEEADSRSASAPPQREPAISIPIGSPRMRSAAGPTTAIS